MSPRYQPKTLTPAEHELIDERRADIEHVADVYAFQSKADQTREALSVRLSDISPYGPDSENSYFLDLAAANRRSADPMATERLARSRSVNGQRAVSTSTLGGVIATMPAWVDQAIEAAVHKAAPLYDALEKIPLPEEGVTIQWFKPTAGSAATAQASENSSVASSDPAASGDAEPFSTVAASLDVSFQSRDRSGGAVDRWIGLDLGQAWGEKVEVDLWQGPGSAGRIRGLENASGVTSVAAGGQTAANQLGALYNCFQQTWAAFGRQPDILTMHERRYGWLAQAVAGAPMDFGPDGVQLVVSPGGSTNLGGGSNEDRPHFLARSAVPLATNGPQVSVHAQATGNALMARFVISGYLAFATAARPEAIGRITNLTTPTFS